MNSFNFILHQNLFMNAFTQMLGKIFSCIFQHQVNLCRPNAMHFISYILHFAKKCLLSHFTLRTILSKSPGGCWMLREGEKTIKTTKYFDFTSGWASVCTSPKWKSTKTGNRSSQTFLVVLKHPVNLSETISSVQHPALLNLKRMDNFLRGQKHI